MNTEIIVMALAIVLTALSAYMFTNEILYRKSGAEQARKNYLMNNAGSIIHSRVYRGLIRHEARQQPAFREYASIINHGYKPGKPHILKLKHQIAQRNQELGLVA